mmetsp:Transcript_6947/g.11199  ORF Transcript_6947/g.11199 Transcript_6947/m.11199 type:complete len:179 (-) Transcript_6947:203-739(-)
MSQWPSLKRPNKQQLLNVWAILFCLQEVALVNAVGEVGATSRGHGWIGVMVLDKPDPEDCVATSANGDSLYVEYEVFIDEQPQGKNKLEFKLGQAPVDGWDQHLAGMCIEEERELTIPPSTHGHRNIGMKDDVPKDSVLQFRIRLLDINGQQRKSQYARWKDRDKRLKEKRRKQKSDL